ncbi:hypothetical protein L7F22_038150 [Adiantum nelumboides]|nr:hypothetical protein [Adiantum nelumboides]
MFGVGSETEISETSDGLKDEILSADLGQGSMHEIDQTLATEESNLQIVPWNFQEEVGASKDSEDEKKIFMHKEADILYACRVLSYFDCPPIPLCRLIPYARVKGLRDDVSGLKAAFGKEGYIQEKGAFIVFLWNCQKEKILILDKIINKWDAIWKDINDEFEQELSKPMQLKDMSNHMFYVWEGNHWIVAWMDAIQERIDLYNNGLSHDVDNMNTHSLVVTHICDEIINTTHICAADHEVYLKDPSLGTNWLAKVLGLKWGANSWVTLEKINMIATHDAPVQNKILWISLLEADMVLRTAYGLGKSDVAFREFLSFLVSKTVLPVLPFLARQWTQMSTPNSCMDSTELHDLMSWEIEHYLGWIDMKKGQLLICERELKQAMIRDDTGSGSIWPRGGGGQQLAGGPSCLGNEPVVDSTKNDSMMPDIGRACSSINLDDCLIISYVQSLISSRKRPREEASTSLDVDEEVDLGTGLNPYNDYNFGGHVVIVMLNVFMFHGSALPIYAEEMAKTMVVNPHYDSLINEEPRRRSVFVDDECDSS